ncbi:hypothetical protein GCM10028812_53490 [Ancylobacter sonchi]
MGARRDAHAPCVELHRDETEEQIEQLQQVFELIDKRPQGKTCPAIDGILEEGEEILDEFKGEPARMLVLPPPPR